MKCGNFLEVKEDDTLLLILVSLSIIILSIWLMVSEVCAGVGAQTHNKNKLLFNQMK